MTESEIEAAYGPVQASFGPSRAQIAAGIGIAIGLFVVGLVLVLAAALFHRDGARSSIELGLGFVGVFLGIVTPLLIARATWQTSSDRLELRAMGLVRRSKSLGLKHTRYADLARIEERRRGERTTHIHVFTTQGGLVGVSGFAREPREMIDDLERRAQNAGTRVRIERVEG